MTSSSTKSRSLQIIVVGFGDVGRTLIERLRQEGHSITLIDRDPAAIEMATNLYDVMGFVGNGASYELQEKAGVSNADLLIAVTDSDELNLLCCIVAEHIGKCAVIAKVSSPDYGREVSYLQSKLSLAMIVNPELEAAREIARILSLPAATSVKPFYRGNAELIEFRVPEDSALDGLSLAQLRSRISSLMLVCAVKRDQRVLIPNGNFTLQVGDMVSVVGAKHFAREFLKEAGLDVEPVKDCIIVGGGRSAYYLAEMLGRAGVEVRIIEQDRERCEELSETLRKTIVINGDGSNEDLLNEEGLGYVDSFVPLTGEDDTNVFLSLYARRLSPGAKVITQIDRMNFRTVIEDLKLDSVVYPKYVVTETIITYVRAASAVSRGGALRSLYHIMDNKVEAAEFSISEGSKVIGVPLKNMKLKKGVLVALVSRGGSILIPGGSDMLAKDDLVLVLTQSMGLNAIDDILAQDE